MVQVERGSVVVGGCWAVGQRDARSDGHGVLPLPLVGLDVHQCDGLAAAAAAGRRSVGGGDDLRVRDRVDDGRVLVGIGGLGRKGSELGRVYGTVLGRVGGIVREVVRNERFVVVQFGGAHVVEGVAVVIVVCVECELFGRVGRLVDR